MERPSIPPGLRCGMEPDMTVANRGAPRMKSTGIDVARIELSCGSFDALRAVHFTRRFPPHFHDTFAIGVVESGATQVRTHRGEWIARAGSILAFSPGEIHGGESLSEHGFSYRMIYPAPAFLGDIGAMAGNEPGIIPLFRTPVIDDLTLGAALLRAHVSIMDGVKSDEAEESLIAVLQSLVATHIAPGDAVVPMRHVDLALAERTRECLELRYAERVLISVLAEEFGVNLFRLIRVFRRVVGVSPYAYLVQFRVNRAKELLGQGVGIATVACLCGFSDQPHLTRTFRKVVGVPPGQYVRQAGHSAA